MRRFALVLLVLAAFAAACTNNEETAGEQTNTSFTIRGKVVSAKQDGSLPTPTGETSTLEGVLSIEVDSDSDVSGGIGDCRLPAGNFTVYYDDNTKFEPAGTERSAAFPRNLDNHQVTATGTAELPEKTVPKASPTESAASNANSNVNANVDANAGLAKNDCLLVADSVRLGAAEPAGTAGPAASVVPAPTRTASPQPTAGATPANTAQLPGY